jgi:hypothetical protein
MVNSQGSAHSSVLTLYWSASATSWGSWYLRRREVGVMQGGGQDGLQEQAETVHERI